MRIKFSVGIMTAFLVFSPSFSHAEPVQKLIRNEDVWRKILTHKQFMVLRKGGTDHPFTGKLWDKKDPGTYKCLACQLPLFDSKTKFDSGTGWPSFYEPIAQNHIMTKTDDRHGLKRIEVLCARCESHLGHVFEDGPKPTGLRYCINSTALIFQKR